MASRHRGVSQYWDFQFRAAKFSFRDSAFAPAAVNLSAKGIPASSRRQTGVPAFALISFAGPAAISLPQILVRRSAFQTRHGNKTTIVTLRSGAKHQELCVSKLV